MAFFLSILLKKAFLNITIILEKSKGIDIYIEVRYNTNISKFDVSNQDDQEGLWIIRSDESMSP